MRTLLASLLFLGLALAQTGSQLYQQNCAFCHGDNGQGKPGAFPPLAGHAVELSKTPEGRTHLIYALLFGMQGPVRIKGQLYDGIMPAFAQLNDEQIAALLNYILNAWGNDKLLPREHRAFAPAEVAAARNPSGGRLTPQQVGERRSRIAIP